MLWRIILTDVQTELKQAKQQSLDLHRTGDFFSTLLTLEPGQDLPQPPQEHKQKPGPQLNGISPAANVDLASPFSQPPAPPPQQPLPEKPDGAIPDPTVPRSELKRTETERPRSAMPSPTRQEAPQSSQILSLVEALSTAKREIDSQGDRVKQLEVLLNRERKARESAEERARRLLESHFTEKGRGHEDSTVDMDASEPSSDSQQRGLTNGYPTTEEHSEDSTSDTSSTTTLIASSSPEQLHNETEAVDASTSRLKERIELLVREMDEMKVTMESYKRRAEGAEEERNSLRDMVQKIRDARTNGSAVSSTTPSSPHEDTNPGEANSAINHAIDRTVPTTHTNLTRSNGAAITNVIPDFKELERTVTTVLQQSHPQQGQRGPHVMAMQTAPYASMVGVVLIGVGLMTWLNGWQRGE